MTASRDNAKLPLIILGVLGCAVLAARLLIATGTFHSGLLYLALPFGLSLALYMLTIPAENTTWRKRFWNNFRLSTIVLLASSLVLMEGYVCVVMAMPIFFVGFLLAFLVHWAYDVFKGQKAVHLLPITIFVISLEGVADATTFARFNEVSHTEILAADVTSIRQRLANPPMPQGPRHWILSIFPMPRSIGNVTLNAGDVRVYEFVYHRWFTTNTHRGQLKVKLIEVSEERIRTKIEDTSYISSYLKLHGSELIFEPIGPNSTRVTMKVRFARTIDPAWYFQPLERYAVKNACKYFLTNILGDGTTSSTLAGNQAS